MQKFNEFASSLIDSEFQCHTEGKLSHLAMLKYEKEDVTEPSCTLLEFTVYSLRFSRVKYTKYKNNKF